MTQVSKRSLVLALVLVLGTAPGCYHYRIKDPESSVSASGKRTVHSLAWGLIQQDTPTGNCEGKGLAEVRVTTNLGFTLLTIVTLGFWAPAQVEWQCRPPEPPEGEI
jgi:hypothetical protein